MIETDFHVSILGEVATGSERGFYVSANTCDLLRRGLYQIFDNKGMPSTTIEGMVSCPTPCASCPECPIYQRTLELSKLKGNHELAHVAENGVNSDPAGNVAEEIRRQERIWHETMYIHGTTNPFERRLGPRRIAGQIRKVLGDVECDYLAQLQVLGIDIRANHGLIVTRNHPTNPHKTIFNRAPPEVR